VVAGARWGKFHGNQFATEPVMKMLPYRLRTNRAAAAILAMTGASTRHNVTLADLRCIGSGA
jgi:hypothetical protein